MRMRVVLNLLVVQDCHSICLISQQVRQQPLPRTRKFANGGSHRGAVEHMTNIDDKGGQNDDKRRRASRNELSNHELRRAREDDSRHGLRNARRDARAECGHAIDHAKGQHTYQDGKFIPDTMQEFRMWCCHSSIIESYAMSVLSDIAISCELRRTVQEAHPQYA